MSCSAPASPALHLRNDAPDPALTEPDQSRAVRTRRASNSGAKRLGPADLVRVVLDAGSFTSWDAPITDPPIVDMNYVRELNDARLRTGFDESVLTGEGRLQGRRVAVVGSDFGFLGGSIGTAAASRLVRAIERSTSEGLPLLAAPVSGGTRMQEGTLAFVQMLRITAAVSQHKKKGLPYLVYLRHPTTGGALASWGSLGHLTIAEPGALVGFLGPRVFEAMHGRPFPERVQLSENLFDHGVIDGVVPPEELAEVLDRALSVVCAERVPRIPTGLGDLGPLADAPAWESIELSRRPGRPGVGELLAVAASDVVRLSGTGGGERDPAVVVALARFGDSPCVIVGQDRTAEIDGHRLGPSGLREARRGMRLASELNLPLVTVVDTAGADLSAAAEEGALAGEIARCLEDMITLQSPTVAVLLGQGTGGAALALVPGDRVVAAEHSWLSPLPPEGASAILFRDTLHAAEMAQRQGVRAKDLKANRIVDRLIPEGLDATEDPTGFCRRVGRVIEYELAHVLSQEQGQRLRRRHYRLSRLGVA